MIAPGHRPSVPMAGIGLRPAHATALLAGRPPLPFIEVHSENYFADGGAALAQLRELRAHYPLSLHGVGLGLGSAVGLDGWHLDRLARLVERIEPLRVSDHACFARAGGAATSNTGASLVHANDLLPLAFTAAALDIMAANVGRVQQRLGRALLVENLSSYLSFADDAMSEPEFFTRLCRRSGCAMLLDVNNLMVNALNAQAPDPLAACCAFIDALPPGCVGEIHLAGYGQSDVESEGLVIDDHGSRVRPAVWALYAHAVARFGRVPTLVEWDTELPELELLLGEARHADGLAAAA